MAPIAHRKDGGDLRHPTSERAQLFVVVGIVLAMAVLALAITLVEVDRVVDEHRSEVTHDASAALEFVAAVERESQTLLQTAIDEHDGVDQQVSAFSTALDAWIEQVRTHYASRGAYVDVVIDRDPAHETLVRQNETAPVTSATGEGNWTVVTAANAVAYALTIDEIDESGTGAFRLLVESDRNESRWLSVHERESTTVTDHEGNEWTTNGSVTVDFDAGTLNGDDHPAAQLLDGLRDYDVRYENANRVRGTYALVVDDEAEISGVGGDEEKLHTSDVLSGVDLEVRYESYRLQYASTTTLEAGDG
ncbi:hypothetical protein OB905_12360 [Halobacteria archaeon AArc-dxtr1]|nr:hypothetical protein [Halobacteria archaeon AArc-dxtr1]